MSIPDESGPSRYLSVDEFIEMNRRDGRSLVGRTATYEALRRGDLPHVRFGRKILIPANALDLMLARRETRARLESVTT